MAIDALRVIHFRRGLRDEIQPVCRSPRPLTYTDLFNIALGVKDDQALIKKSMVAKRGFLGRGSFYAHQGVDRVIPFD